jgi:predicted enzyme related to lactoylglutathione lyase
MDVRDFTLNLTSEDPARLASFYGDVVGLPADDSRSGHSFRIGSGRLRITPHDETRGMAKEPTRCLINLFVTDVEAELDRLREQGVAIIRKATREKWGGLVSTLADPDGNYFQLIEDPRRQEEVRR